MAKKILTSINLLKNELQNAVIQNLSVAPENPKEGLIYFNTTTHKFCVYENGAWVSYATVADMDAALALKADKATVEGALALKADKETVEGALATKVDAETYASDKSELETAINSKVSAEVYTQEHADQNAAIEAAAGQAESNRTAIITINDVLKQQDATDQRLEGLINTNAQAIEALNELVGGEVGDITAALDLKADKATTYTKDEVDAELAKKADKETTYTKEEVNATVTGLEASIATKVAKVAYDEKVAALEAADVAGTKALTDYKAEMVETLAGKADKATTLAGYGIADAYTKEEVDAKVASVYRFKGSVETFDALPTEGLVEGDTYNVKATGENYAWVAPAAGEEAGHWDDLGGDIDLTPYATKEEVAATYETIANVAAIKEELEAAIEDVRGEAGEGAAGATHKLSFTNEELTPVAGVVTWTIVHTYGADVNVILKEVATGEEVIAEILQANNTVTVKMNAESVVTANTYKAVIIG